MSTKFIKFSDFSDISLFSKIVLKKSYVVQQLVKQILYTGLLLIITLRFISPVFKGKLAKPSKSLKIL